MSPNRLGPFSRPWARAAERLEEFNDHIVGLIEVVTAFSRSDEQKRIKDLQRELKRKEAALAETAALLVLRKKAGALWGGEGEDT